MLDKEILKRLDYQLELDKQIIDELVAIRNTIKEMNSKPLLNLKKNDLIQEFIDQADGGDVYELYCEYYPEHITSDFEFEDIPDEFICNEFVEVYFEKWLKKKYGLELDMLE